MSDDHLAESLGGLSTVLAGHRPLEETLVVIAEFAVHAVPGADGAGLTMLEEGRARTMVATADFVHQMDEIQYGHGQGPSLTALESARTQTSGSLGGDARWPGFGCRAGRMGVHSVLALPLRLPGRVLGVLNVYSHVKDAFGVQAQRTGEAFARPAAVAAHNAQVLAASQRLTAQLQEALIHRAVIDQAIGVLMSRTGVGPVEAFDRLRSMSQAEHVKVADLARSLVEQARRRARALGPGLRREP